MSFVSRARKVKKKGTVQQLKLVQSVSRRGLDTLTTEAVETPQRQTEKASLSSQSLSPRKRQKLNDLAAEPLPSNSEGPIEFEERERETLVFVPNDCHFRFSNNAKTQHDFVKQFLEHERTYLRHLLDLELPPFGLTCTKCGEVEAQFRCLDCYGPHWWCQACLIEGHYQ